MNSESIISAFESLDLKSYIDRTIKAADQSILKNELRKHKRLLSVIDNELYSAFEGNIDSLMIVLKKNSEINKKIQLISEKFSELKPIYDLLKESNPNTEEPINKLQSQRLKRLIDDFEPSAHSFATKSRYLIHYEILLAEESTSKKRISNDESSNIDENESKFRDKIDIEITKIQKSDTKKSKSVYILIFTNDLLIIGKKSNKTFKLVNAFNYGVVSFNLLEKSLILDADPFSFTFFKDRKSLQEVFFVFQNIMSEYCNDSKNKIQTVQKDTKNVGFMKFLQWTEQYEELARHAGSYIDELIIEDESDQIEHNLEAIMYISDIPKRFIKIRKIYTQLLSDKLERLQFSRDIYKYVECCYQLYRTVLDDFEIAAISFCGNIIESSLYKCEMFLFNEYLHIMILEKCMPYANTLCMDKRYKCPLEFFINKHLFTSRGDFTYLLALYDEDYKKMKERSVKSVKTKIEKILERMLSQE